MNLSNILRFSLALPATIFLNPICFIFFFLFFQSSGFKPKGVNVSIIIFSKYTVFALLFFCLSNVLIFGVNKIASYQTGSFIEFVYQLGSWNWKSLISWLLMLFILNIYRVGMEGNIMGFFGVPIILVATLFLLLSTWSWINQGLWTAIGNISLPLLSSYNQLSFFGNFLFSVILNPLTVFIIVSNAKKMGNAGVIGDLILNFLSSTMTVAFFLTVWIFILWITKNLFFEKIGLGTFFQSYILIIHQFKVISFILSGMTLTFFLFETFTQFKITSVITFLTMTSTLTLFASGIQSLRLIFKSKG